MTEVYIRNHVCANPGILTQLMNTIFLFNIKQKWIIYKEDIKTNKH